MAPDVRTRRIAKTRLSWRMAKKLMEKMTRGTGHGGRATSNASVNANSVLGRMRMRVVDSPVRGLGHGRRS
jgi:hypothetical protein